MPTTAPAAPAITYLSRTGNVAVVRMPLAAAATPAAAGAVAAGAVAAALVTATAGWATATANLIARRGTHYVVHLAGA